MENNQKTYTQFKEYQDAYMNWLNSMPKFYNHRYLAIAGVFCNDGTLDENDAKEFMFPNIVEVDNMDFNMIKFAFITMMNEWESKVQSIIDENN